MCMKVYRYSKAEREIQISRVAVVNGYSFSGWVGDYQNNESKAIIKCSTHGEWHVALNNFLKGGRCPRCALNNRVEARKIPQDVREQQIRNLAELDGYTFVGWVGDYVGNRSQITMRCDEHGDWVTNVNAFVDASKRCITCGGREQIPQDVRERQLRELSEIDGYIFIGWVDGYKNSYSKAIINCQIHGDWYTDPIRFIHAGSRCPSCALPGYRPALQGVLYALLSECKSMIKIGISNKPTQRYTRLTKATPFNFIVYRQLHCEDGSQPPMLERMFHSQFPSAGLTGFDGATEWRRMSPDVTTWLDLLGAQ